MPRVEPPILASRNNPKIKAVRELRQRKARQESGLFLAEGIRHVGEALAAIEASAGALWATAPLQVEAIFYAPEVLSSPFARELIARGTARSIPCHATSEEVFGSMADRENPQGILAVARAPRTELSRLDGSNFAWGVALVKPQDPGNVGAILRTIDAVGASGLLLLGGGVDPYHPTAVRSSMGAIFWLPVVQVSFAEFAIWARQGGYRVYGTSAHAQTHYKEIEDYERPAVLLMGSERQGLNPEQVDVCQAVVRLPMHGRVTSLNLAVATGVMLYAMLE